MPHHRRNWIFEERIADQRPLTPSAHKDTVKTKKSKNPATDRCVRDAMPDSFSRSQRQSSVAMTLTWSLSPTCFAGVDVRQRSWEGVHDALHCVMLPVLDVDPTIRPAGTIAALAVLWDQAFESHQTGVAKQVRADLALFEWLQMDAVDTPRQE